MAKRKSSRNRVQKRHKRSSKRSSLKRHKKKSSRRVRHGGDCSNTQIDVTPYNDHLFGGKKRFSRGGNCSSTQLNITPFNDFQYGGNGEEQQYTSTTAKIKNLLDSLKSKLESGSCDNNVSNGNNTSLFGGFKWW
jgi:hypothetical protein